MIIKYDNQTPSIHTSCFVAESSSVIGKVTIGESSSIWYGTVLRGDVNTIDIGERTNIQDNATVHVAGGFPTKIGDDVTIGHNAIVHGCTIGDRVLIGMGAIVLDGAIIENDVIIGAGALIPPGKVILSKSLVVGSPGKVVKTLNEEAIQGLLESSAIYVKEASLHKQIK